MLVVLSESLYIGKGRISRQGKKGRLLGHPFTFLKPLRHILTPHAAERVAYFTEGDVVFHALDEQRH